MIHLLSLFLVLLSSGGFAYSSGMSPRRPIDEKLLAELDKGLYLDDVSTLIPIIKDLLNKGASVNAQDINGARPLDKAILLGNTTVVKLLLDNQADPNLTDFNGWAPLHMASKIADRELMKLLLSYGAKTTLSNGNGLIPAALLEDLPDSRFLGPASKKDLKDLLEHYPLLSNVAQKPTRLDMNRAVYFGLPKLVHAFARYVPVIRFQEKEYARLAQEKYKETEDESYKELGRLFRRRLGLSGPESGIAKRGLTQVGDISLPRNITEYLAQFL